VSSEEFTGITSIVTLVDDGGTAESNEEFVGVNVIARDGGDDV
jgi:hypothetical protein